MFITPAFAQAASGGSGFTLDMVILPVMILSILYFFMIRPQQKRLKEHEALIKAVRRGDTVVTSGGIVGKISKVLDDGEVQVEIADGVRVRIVASTLAAVRAKGEPALDAKN